MMKLKAVLVEDEAQSREILRNYLAKYCADVEILGEAATVAEGVDLIRKTLPDILFLDVEMPFGNAFDLIDQLPDRDFEIVFVTAYDQYALEALNNHAAYYLMKPIDIDELLKAVRHVSEIKNKERELEQQLLSTGLPKASGKLTLPQQDGFQVIDISDILYCKADDNYTEIHLLNKKILVSKTLKYFEEALSDNGFARTHKSFLVNVNEIVKYRKGKGGSVVLTNGKELLVSASRKRQLLSFFK
jgi:two-component system LytT family response regulator